MGILGAEILVAERCSATVCGRSLAGIAGSNPAGGMDVSSVSVVRYRSLQQADHSSRGILSTVVCHCVRCRNLKNEAVGFWLLQTSFFCVMVSISRAYFKVHVNLRHFYCISHALVVLFCVAFCSFASWNRQQKQQLNLCTAKANVNASSF